MAKILIVDDSQIIASSLKKDFEKWGFEVTLKKNGYTDFCEAPDGAEALKLYQEIKPDLVLMDITMPNMDGLEALKAIKSYDSEAKVVMCSAMGQESMVIDAIKSGAKDFIVKPFKPDRIIKTVSSILG